MKEMVGGCCVCSDERGWTENPLVYCDGQGCTVAVHQACYGIVTVPSGPWFCRKCESQERAARVRCELCPSKDGALKRTDNTGWAHVVCALYIPEVRFGNVTTMEPIILSLVPADRFNKACYICESQGKESKSTTGACMQCNKTGCKHHFHVTCAQALGLLCEEAGNYMDNVKYCGYCQHHYSKLKKGSNVKTIPAFKPLPAAGSTAGSTPEKMSPSHPSGSGWVNEQHSNVASVASGNAAKEKQRKKAGRKPAVTAHLSSPKAANNKELVDSSMIVEASVASGEDGKLKTPKSEMSSFTDVLAGVGLVPGPRVTSTESAGDASGSLRTSETIKQEPIKHSELVTKTSAKRNSDCKSSGGFHEPSAPSDYSYCAPPAGYLAEKSRPHRRKGRSTTPSSLGGNDTESTLSNVSDLGINADVDQMERKEVITEVSDHSGPSANTHSVIVSSAANSIIYSTSCITNYTPSSTTSLATSQQIHQMLSHTVFPSQQQQRPLLASGVGTSDPQGLLSNYGVYEPQAAADRRPVISQVKKVRKSGRPPKSSLPAAVPDSPPSSPDSAGLVAPTTEQSSAKKRKKVGKSAEPPIPAKIEKQTNEPAPVGSLVSADNNRDSSQTLLDKEDSIRSYNVSASKETDLITLIKDATANKKPVVFKPVANVSDNLFQRNGVSAPHMLGNQLNPASSMAQKMSDTLTAELEAHRVFSHHSPVCQNSVFGVPFPSRSVSPIMKISSAITSAPFPQNLEQLLERQWEQGSQFLMEQAQHFDIASLLSCLHNLRQENMRLEDHVANLSRRRDHLLAVNARLSVPLALHPTASYSGGAPVDRSTPTGHELRSPPQERNVVNRSTSYLPPVENGVPDANYVVAGSASGGHRATPLATSHPSSHCDRVLSSPVIVTSWSYPTAAPPTTTVSMQSTFLGDGRNLSVLRSTTSTPETRQDQTRSTATPQQQYPVYQMVSPPLQASHHPSHSMGTPVPVSVVTSQQHMISNRRGEALDPRHPLSKPSPSDRR